MSCCRKVVWLFAVVLLSSSLLLTACGGGGGSKMVQTWYTGYIFAKHIGNR